MDLFRHPSYLLYLLLAAGGSAALAAWSDKRRRRLAEAFAKAAILPRLHPDARERRRLRYALKSAALCLLFLALAGPQWGVELVSTRSSAVQALIAVDVSASMLAEDLKPNRMEAAKNELSLLLDGLRGQRVGLVAFAGEAQIQCPMTTDIEAAKTFLRRMSAGLIRQPGTALGKALDLGVTMLSRYPGQKALVLLTDGEDHEPGALEAARRAAETGVHIYVIGMGTLEGEPIPVKDDSGRITGYKKDAKGQTVVSRLGEDKLLELAKAASGAYFRASAMGGEAGEIVNQVLQLERSTTETGSRNRYRDRYRIPLALAFLLLVLELLITELPAADGRARKLLKELAKAAPRLIVCACAKVVIGAAPALLLFLFLAGCKRPQSTFRLWRGNENYKIEDYQEALKQYALANQKRPNDVRPIFNSGATLYRMGEFDEAQKAFEALSDPRKVPPELAAKSLYNMGNTLYRKEQHKEAAEAYKNCLLLNPNDEDCRYNLVLALKSPPPQQQKKDQQKDQKDKNEDKKDQQKPSDPKQQPPQGKSGLSKEDAERILSAVKEKEKAANNKQTAPQQPQPQSAPQQGMDW